MSGKTEPSDLFALCQEKMNKLDSFQWTHTVYFNTTFVFIYKKASENTSTVTI